MRLLLAALLSVLAPGWTPAAESAPELIVEAQSPEGEFDYDLTTGVATADKGVVVRYAGAVLTAQRVTVMQAKDRIFAQGNVRLEREGQTWVGDSVSYNYKTKQLDADFFRTAQGPFYAAGEVVGTDPSNNTYTARGAYVTTDDHSRPVQRVRAKQITIVPGKSIEARGATLYVAGVPVLYMPYYRRSLERHPNNFSFVPGYRGRFGPYLLSSYNWYLNDRVDGALHFDYRMKRGLGGGPDLNLHLGRWGEAEFKGYYAHDEAPDLQGPAETTRADRERLAFLYRNDLSNNLSLKMAARYQSDPWLIRDFFEDEYRRNVQPGSFLEVNKLWRHWSLDALAQPRLNDFMETVERLPDLKLTGFRQQLGRTPLFYESESSFGWYRRLYANDQGLDYSAWRGDTFHQVVLPQTFFGWLNLTPRIGGRFTQYSAADGPGGLTASDSRFVLNTGLEVSTKASRVWPGLHSRFLDINGLRHIVEPSFNYAFVPTPNRRPPHLPQFDYELRSYRLLPLDFPDYNAIDSVDAQNAIRLGLRNRLQTKRGEGIEELLNWALYSDWRINPRAGQPTFSEVYSDLDFVPRSWLAFSQETRMDVNTGQLKEWNHRLSILPGDRWTWTVGNRYLRYDPLYPADLKQNLYYSSIFYKLNENWAVRLAHHFEGRDGRMEEQYYTLYRDLRSWTAAVTVRLRSERARDDDFTIALTLSLKAFPRFKLGEDADRPNLLMGG